MMAFRYAWFDTDHSFPGIELYMAVSLVGHVFIMEEGCFINRGGGMYYRWIHLYAVVIDVLHRFVSAAVITNDS